MDTNEVDSLDQIISIIHSKESGDNWSSRNQDSYQILPNSDNHASSFGPGGRLPQVIDPDFRAPATASFVDQMNDTSTDDRSNVSNINLDTIPLPISNQLTRPTGTISFTLPEKTTSFSDLARTSSANTFTSPSNISYSTLQEYGPPVQSGPVFMNPQNIVDQHRSMSNGAMQPYINPVQPATSNYNNMNPGHGYGAHIGFIPPTTSSNYVPTIQTTAPMQPAQSVSSGFSEATSSAQTTNQPLYSPPVSSSPPLDDIDMSNAVPSIPDQSSDAQNSNRIPRKTTNVSSSSSDKHDDMLLIPMQKMYRELDDDLCKIQAQQEKLERALNDMMRRNHGRNVELDPTFRQMKDEQKKLNEDQAAINLEKKALFRKCYEKFHFMLLSRPPPPIVSNQPKRAKMSTGAPTPKIAKRVTEEKGRRVAFDLRDPKTWCRSCDEHFDSLKEYCVHLHTRTHCNSIKSAELKPWRRTPKPRLSQRETFDFFKSICARLSNDLKTSFDIKDLDNILYHNNSAKEGSRSTKNVRREQGKFDAQDRLFELKGYNHLIPISGYYCSLCDRTLCDPQDTEEHLKGYDHNYSYAKSVALNSDHEMGFRTQLDKSYVKHFGREIQKEQPSKSSSKQEAPSSKTTVINLPTVRPYKKATSYIVDEHEVIADEFTKRNTVTTNAPQVDASKDKNEGSSESVRRKITSVVPEILPIGNCQPSALKRLRNQSTASTSKDAATARSTSSGSSESPEADDRDSQSVQFIEEIHLNCGDPDSPFPDLDLSVTGNAHVGLLKDKRLAGPCHVVVEKIDLKEWEDGLLDEATMWTRIFQLVAKKEPDQLRKDIKSKNTTRPTFFSASGADIPVDVEAIEEEKIKSEEKPRLSQLNSDIKSDADGKPYCNELRFEHVESDDSDAFQDSKEGTEGPMLKILKDFFTE